MGPGCRGDFQLVKSGSLGTIFDTSVQGLLIVRWRSRSGIQERDGDVPRLQFMHLDRLPTNLDVLITHVDHHLSHCHDTLRHEWRHITVHDAEPEVARKRTMHEWNHYRVC